MQKWRLRFAAFLELIAIGLALLLVLQVLVRWLDGVIAPSSDTVLNLGVMVAAVLWLGRLSVFGFLGSRAAGRAGEVWPAVPAGIGAMVVTTLAVRGWVTAAAPGLDGAISGVASAVVADPPWLEWAIGAALAVVGAAVGPKLRGAPSGDPSRWLAGAGALVVALLAAVVAVGATQGLRSARSARQLVERATAPASAVLAPVDTLLQRVAEAQSGFRATAPSFARSVVDLELRVPDGVELRMVYASPNGWAAQATPRGRREGCATWDGRVPSPPTTPGGRPVPRGRVVCDR